jgi:Uma2 family endonuclease
MTQPQPVYRCTPEEYLRREGDAAEKHEFYHGEVFAMAGGTPDHSLIISNFNRELGNRLKGKPCRVYGSNLRIRIPRTTLYTYPDVGVICGERQFDPLDVRKETVTNPALLVEALSPSTEAWDRGGKFKNYQVIESLREYVLVASDAARIETYLRQEDGTWIYSAAAGLDAVAQLKSLKVELPLAEVYSGVEIPAQSSDKPAV